MDRATERAAGAPILRERVGVTDLRVLGCRTLISFAEQRVNGFTKRALRRASSLLNKPFEIAQYAHVFRLYFRRSPLHLNGGLQPASLRLEATSRDFTSSLRRVSRKRSIRGGVQERCIRDPSPIRRQPENGPAKPEP